MEQMTFKATLDTMRKEIDRSIEKTIRTRAWDVPLLEKAVHYSISGGKRLRSIIMLSMFSELSDLESKPMAFAAAIEMIQAYSLVHDDLPCMDDDDYRRGKPSCHKKFGEATAVLCGDALLTMAFESMLTCEDVPLVAVLKAAVELAKAIGPQGMVGGQVLDLLFENEKVSCFDVKRMYTMKTGALFESSAKSGAILAGASRNETLGAALWGKWFGYAYQLLDDINDAGTDGKEEVKNTMLKITSLKEVCKETRSALEKSKEALASIGLRGSLVDELSTYYLCQLDKIERAL